MKRIVASLVGSLAATMPSLALAYEGSGYRGIASMYYTFIAMVLVYGVYDTFGKKGMYIGAPVIIIGAYFLTSLAPE